MEKCRICKVPLSGFLSKIAKLLFGVEPSADNPKICNKCIGSNLSAESKDSNNQQGQDTGNLPENKYECQLCGRLIRESHSLEHIKAEEYLLSLIQKDHPQWQDKQPTCQECLKYYRKLIKESEI